MNKKLKCQQRGFSLIELMLGIGILAILMGVGIPSYQGFVKNNCMTTSSTTLVSSLQFARAEAIKQRADISVVANTVSGTTDWDNGWTVQDGAATVIKQFYKGGCDLTTMTEAGSNATTITYASTGFLSAPATVTMRICDDRNNQQESSPGREITVSATGRPSTDSRYTGTGCP